MEISAVDYLLAQCGQHVGQFGGRGLTDGLDTELIRKLARLVLREQGQHQTAVTFHVKAEANRLKFTVSRTEGHPVS